MGVDGFALDDEFSTTNSRLTIFLIFSRLLGYELVQ
jgi:hypothetical protein